MHFAPDSRMHRSFAALKMKINKVQRPDRRQRVQLIFPKLWHALHQITHGGKWSVRALSHQRLPRLFPQPAGVAQAETHSDRS